MTTPACPSYAGYRFPAEIISHAVWLYFRFPLSLRMVDESLAARGVLVSHETVRQWALKFGSPALCVDCDGRALVFVKDDVASHKVTHEHSMPDPWLPDRTGDT